MNPQLPQLGFLLLNDATDNSQLPQLFNYHHRITPPKPKRDPETSSGRPAFNKLFDRSTTRYPTVMLNSFQHLRH